MAAHYYSDTAVSTTLVTGISNSATSMEVASVSGFPVSYPYYLAIDRETASREVVEVTNAVGTILTVVRGASTTVATSHSSGAVVEHCAPSDFYQDAEAHADLTAAHGVTGDVVGTSDTQTLTNKTIAVAGNTFDAALDALGAVTPAADRVPYYTGASSAAVTPLTLFGRSLISDSDAASARSTLGVSIGSDVQAYDAGLSSLAGLGPQGLVCASAADTFTLRQLLSTDGSLTITNPLGVADNPNFSVTDGGWQTSGFSIQTDFTAVINRYRVFAGKFVFVEIECTRSGADIVAPATGNIANTSVIQLPPSIRPGVGGAGEVGLWECTFTASATNGGAYVSSSGTVTLASMNSGSTLATGNSLYFSLNFVLD